MSLSTYGEQAGDVAASSAYAAQAALHIAALQPAVRTLAELEVQAQHNFLTMQQAVGGIGASASRVQAWR